MDTPRKYEQAIKGIQKKIQEETPPLSDLEDRQEAWNKKKAEQRAKFDPNNLEQTELF